MDGLHRGIQKQGGLCVRRRPAGLTIDALPVQIELAIDQHDRFGAPAPGTGDVVLIKDVDMGRASSHTQGCRLAQTDAIDISP